MPTLKLKKRPADAPAPDAERRPPLRGSGARPRPTLAQAEAERARRRTAEPARRRDEPPADAPPRRGGERPAAPRGQDRDAPPRGTRGAPPREPGSRTHTDREPGSRAHASREPGSRTPPDREPMSRSRSDRDPAARPAPARRNAPPSRDTEPYGSGPTRRAPAEAPRGPRRDAETRGGPGPREPAARRGADRREPDPRAPAGRGRRDAEGPAPRDREARPGPRRYENEGRSGPARRGADERSAPTRRGTDERPGPTRRGSDERAGPGRREREPAPGRARAEAERRPAPAARRDAEPARRAPPRRAGAAAEAPPAKPLPRTRRTPGPDATTDTPDTATLPRLSKRMSELGLASRREADEWIERGFVRVDGEVVDQLGARVRPEQAITIDPEARQEQAQRVTVLLHKPLGYVSGQAEDGHEPAVSLVRAATRWAGDAAKQRFQASQLKHLVPAGRLDLDSTGLLVLTQDGRVAKLLIGEESPVEKEYVVRVSWPGHPGDTVLKDHFPADELARLRHGLVLDGEALRPAKVSWQSEQHLRFVLREGKKRQIRRMCELVGLKVETLKRIRIGRVSLGDLPPGQWRYLGPFETFL